MAARRGKGGGKRGKNGDARGKKEEKEAAAGADI